MNNTIQAEKQQAAIDLHSRIDSSFVNHASKTKPARVNMFQSTTQFRSEQNESIKRWQEM
jgi:hypothetical protein